MCVSLSVSVCVSQVNSMQPYARPTCEMVIKLFMRIHERFSFFYACDQVVFKMNYEIFGNREREGERGSERGRVQARES